MLRDYVFLESTRSFCSTCRSLCDAKVVVKNGSAYLLKRCLTHGEQLELFEEDASYLTERRRFEKPGTRHKADRRVERGCPYDCGLCPDHEQHTCIGLIEVTHACDLVCPVCYAGSGHGEHLPLARISEMMDFYKAREGGKPEILQVGGGEPTSHPEIEAILTTAKRKGFRYLMLNTNGLRIAADARFAGFLATLTPGFEVYLQFDGTKDKAYRKLRGRDLVAVKRAAVANLQAARVPMTLVATVARGVNDDQIGDIVRYGLETDCVRGVNFQPMAFFGRGNGGDVANRITLSGIRREIERQTGGLFTREDIVPLPCDTDRVAVSYAVRNGDGFTPVTRRIRMEGYLELIDNTMDFRAEDLVKNAISASVTKGMVCDCLRLRDELTAILPEGYVRWAPAERARFIDSNTFRITIASFIDMHNYDARSVRKECVHVITPDLARVPFSVYNMLHRG